MSSLLLPQKGAHPWLPADNVLPIQVLNEYNVPLIGLVRQSEAMYLYACLVGELDDLNIWAYARLSDAEVDRLESLLDEDLTAAVQESLANRMLVVALAFDYELVEWERIDSGVEGPSRIARRFLDKLQRRLMAVQGYVEKLEEDRALAPSC